MAELREACYRVKAAAFHGGCTLSWRRNVFQFLAIAVGASGAILAAAGLYVWADLTSGEAATPLAYLNSLQVDNTIVTYNPPPSWPASNATGKGSAQPSSTSGEFEKLVNRSEAVLTDELTGWVQQMRDAMQEIENKQPGVADRIESGMAAEPPGHPPTA